MSTDWASGDLALCIKQGAWKDFNTQEVLGYGPQCGQIYKVKYVIFDGSKNKLFLVFPKWPLDQYYSIRFIKVTPIEEDGFDEEVIKIMNKQTENA